jgi:hypothetical protein
VSSRALAWALRQKPGSPTLQLILIHYADNAGSDGICHCNHREIAGWTGLARETVTRNLKTLSGAEVGGFMEPVGDGRYRLRRDALATDLGVTEDHSAPPKGCDGESQGVTENHSKPKSGCDGESQDCDAGSHETIGTVPATGTGSGTGLNTKNKDTQVRLGNVFLLEAISSASEKKLRNSPTKQPQLSKIQVALRGSGFDQRAQVEAFFVWLWKNHFAGREYEHTFVPETLARHIGKYLDWFEGSGLKPGDGVNAVRRNAPSALDKADPDFLRFQQQRGTAP